MARALVAGVDPYAPAHLLAGELSSATGATFDHPSPHPPSLLPMLLPMAIFDYRSVATFWILLEVAAIGGTVLLLRRLRGFSRAAALLIFLVVLGSDSARFSLVFGQFGCFLALLTAAFVVALKEERHILAGAALGLAVAIKFWGAPLFVWLALQRRWRTLASAGVVAGALHALSLAFLSPAAWFDYFLQVAPEVASRYVHHPANISLTSMSPALALALGVLGVIFTLRDAKVGLIYMLFLTPIVSPIAWLHGVIAWVIPITMTLSQPVSPSTKRIAGLAIAVLLLGMTPPVLWPTLERPLRLLPVLVVMAFASWSAWNAVGGLRTSYSFET
ncbi:MAG: glycosyltransferase family 87 protein [Myxococcota bacterium]